MRAFPLLRSRSVARSGALKFSEHDQCLALSGVFLGKLCEQLVTNLPGRRVPAGASVYLIGERSRKIYFLRRGLVKTSIIAARGQELILQIHRPGDIFGEFCFCGAGQLDQAVAAEISEVVEIPFDVLVTHLQQNRQALLDFLNTIAERTSELYSQLRVLSVDKRMERLVRTLLRLAEGFGAPTAKGVKIVHPFKQEEVAEMIAARREVVSGLLNQLRKMQLISYSRKHSITIDKERLQEYLRTISS